MDFVETKNKVSFNHNMRVIRQRARYMIVMMIICLMGLTARNYLLFIDQHIEVNVPTDGMTVCKIRHVNDGCVANCSVRFNAHLLCSNHDMAWGFMAEISNKEMYDICQGMCFVFLDDAFRRELKPGFEPIIRLSFYESDGERALLYLHQDAERIFQHATSVTRLEVSYRTQLMLNIFIFILIFIYSVIIYTLSKK